MYTFLCIWKVIYLILKHGRPGFIHVLGSDRSVTVRSGGFTLVCVKNTVLLFFSPIDLPGVHSHDGSSQSDLLRKHPLQRIDTLYDLMWKMNVVEGRTLIIGSWDSGKVTCHWIFPHLMSAKPQHVINTSYDSLLTTVIRHVHVKVCAHVPLLSSGWYWLIKSFNLSLFL